MSTLRRAALAVLLATISFAQSITLPGQGTPVSLTWLYYNKMRWAGAWSGTTTYNPQDVVTYAGRSYVGLPVGNLNNTPAPGGTPYWTPLPVASAGWGAITGTLADQADLAAALAASSFPSGSQTQVLQVQPNTGNNTTYQFAAKPVAYAPDYNYLSQSCNVAASCSSGGQTGLTLSAGIAATITLHPCPRGVVSGSTWAPLYIAGGSGTAEWLTPSGGGSCTSGAASGSVVFTPVNSHVGAWTVGSATGGIAEANLTSAGLGTIMLGPSPINIYAPVVLPSTASLVGQGYDRGYPSSGGSVLICALSANPCMVVADAGGGQGFGYHANYYLEGPNSGTTSGLWIGPDPAGVFTPNTWNGRHLMFQLVTSQGFNNGLTLQTGDFVQFVACWFTGIAGAGRALYIPTPGGSLQYVNFYASTLTVGSGTVVEMNQNNFGPGKIFFWGGQVSGTLKGAGLDWESHGTHYEPNNEGDPIVDVTSTAVFHAFGGLMSVRGSGGTTPPYAIKMISNAAQYLTLRDVTLQCQGGVTVPLAINFAPSSGGELSLEGLSTAGGTFTALYAATNVGLYSWHNLTVNLRQFASTSYVAANAALAFPLNNYPAAGMLDIQGATVGGSGVTSVAGLLYGQYGVLVTDNAQTFSAGATIGSTITTTPSVPYTYYFDGTKVWIK